MSETPQEPTPDEPDETGADVETGDDDERPSDDEDEPEAEPAPGDTLGSVEGRCGAQTTVGGTAYQCSLPARHDGEHAFQPVDATDAADAALEPGLSDEEMRKRSLALAKEAERHEKRVIELVGDDFGEVFTECPLCAPSVPGYTFLQAPSAEVVRAVKHAIGEPEQPDYLNDEHSRVCGQCDGLGTVSTGSKVQGQGLVRCLGCNGNGWVATDSERSAGIVTGGTVHPLPVDYAGTPPAPAEDPAVEQLRALGYTVVPPVEIISPEALGL